MPSIWIGYPREVPAFAVARHSIRRHLTQPIQIKGLVLDDLRERGLYTRPTERRTIVDDKGIERSVLWAVISDATMATEFSNSRFLVPHLDADAHPAPSNFHVRASGRHSNPAAAKPYCQAHQLAAPYLYSSRLAIGSGW